MSRKKGKTAMANKHPENSESDRDTKVQELLSILGELYQRVGYQHAAPTNARLTGPDYQFMGYRPYTMQSMPRRMDVVAPVPMPLASGYFPGQPELMGAPRMPGF